MQLICAIIVWSVVINNWVSQLGGLSPLLIYNITAQWFVQIPLHKSFFISECWFCSPAKSFQTDVGKKNNITVKGPHIERTNSKKKNNQPATIVVPPINFAPIMVVFSYLG